MISFNLKKVHNAIQVAFSSFIKCKLAVTRAVRYVIKILQCPHKTDLNQKKIMYQLKLPILNPEDTMQ